MTDAATGTATVNYISGLDAQTVYIKATVDDNGISGSVELPMQLLPDATLASIYLNADSMSLAVKGTGGIEYGAIHAVGYDINGNRVPEGMVINFVITDAPGAVDEVSLADAGWGPVEGVTNGDGVATVTIHSDTVSGTVRIRAQADTILSNSAQVLIAAGPPAHIVIGASLCNVPYWAHVADTNGIVAVISDRYLNPVNDSVVVYFSCDEGSMMSHHERTQGGYGIATSTWISGNNVTTADGIVVIMAETAGGTVADTGAFFNSHVPSVINTYGMPLSMNADGVSEIVVVVEGLDLNGNPVIGGTPFEGDATYITVEDGIFQNGCYGSSGRSILKSTTLDVDRSRAAQDDGIGAVDNVVFWHGGTAYASYAVSLLTGNSYGANSNVDGPSTVQPNESFYFDVTIKDRWENPLADHSVVLVQGTDTLGTKTTNEYGEAFGYIWVAPALDGTYTITAFDNDPRGGIVLSTSVTVAAATK